MAYITAIIRKVKEDQLSIYSAQASFFIILSLIPFCMLFISLAQFFLPAGTEELLQNFIIILPPSLIPYANDILHELFTAGATPIISTSAVVALWSASKGIMSIENALHEIYDIIPRHGYLVRRLRCGIYTLVFMIILIISMALLIFGPALSAPLVKLLPVLRRLITLLFSFRALIAVLLFVVCFSGLYRLLSGTRLSLGHNLPGVLFTTVGWLVFSQGYSYYVSNFSNYTYLYGTLGAIARMMLWVYFCITILLIGGEINILLYRFGRREAGDCFATNSEGGDIR